MKSTPFAGDLAAFPLVLVEGVGLGQ